MSVTQTSTTVGSQTILNLGCGTRTSPHCVNIDWTLYLRLKQQPMLRRAAMPFLSPARRERLSHMDDAIVVHDLRTGIPAEDASADAVYSSHVVEHIDRDQVEGFLKEIRRVLKPGGILRITTPDLEVMVRNYLESLDAARAGNLLPHIHDRRVHELYEQSVRRMSVGAQQQTGVRQKLDRTLLGDARKRGETHQWAYDEVNLGQLLLDTGFSTVERMTSESSNIAMWPEIDLDRRNDGSEWIDDTLYLEATR